MSTIKAREEAIVKCQSHLEKSVLYDGPIGLDTIYVNQCWMIQALLIILEEMKE